MISTLLGVINILSLCIAPVSKSRDPFKTEAALDDSKPCSPPLETIPLNSGGVFASVLSHYIASSIFGIGSFNKNPFRAP